MHNGTGFIIVRRLPIRVTLRFRKRASGSVKARVRFGIRVFNDISRLGV